ncbi:hypothetical protein L6164_014256 [Bauhinia variegata]|uniref:Uncharacterized protein n=1 Tax=Bauhinia variegata TaxID=167791 RepID=A0ACB9NGY3_BAUVA|nr:hypothetical protein L6164_014256 [Bauhinia variegata]
MKLSLVISLLLLSLLFSKVQGIRWEKESVAAGKQKQHEEESNILKTNNGGIEDANLCKDGKCTGRIMNRKLVSTSISTTHTLSKNVNNEGNEAHPLIEENIKVNALATSKHRELPHEHFPDLVDITEMDYSAARRKPPIHN